MQGGGGSKLSRATSITPRATIELRSYARVERATGKTALLTASASVGVLREAQYPRCAFTMAEILLSLTIIGVVAAITLPSLTGNINERTWNTQRKALYARFSQAIALMPALNGYGTLTEGNESKSAVDTAAETFVTEGLSKVLKINNICDADHLEDCGIPSTITPQNNAAVVNLSSIKTLVGLNNMFNGSYSDSAGRLQVYSQINTKAAGIETQNGESILVYYNPNCISQDISSNFLQPYMCANFMYDLNGSKGPNTFGKDIGVITALYPTDSVVVAPLPLAIDRNGRTSHEEASKFCREKDSESRLPNKEELASLFYNKPLTGMLVEDGQAGYWSSSRVSTDKVYVVGFDGGKVFIDTRGASREVRCIKR